MNSPSPKFLFRATLSILLALALLIPCAQAAEFPSSKEKWIQVSSDHFTLFSNAAPRRAVEVAENLERFRAVLSLFHEGLEVTSPAPTFVYVFKNDRSFHPYKPRYRGQTVDLDGIYLGHPMADYLVMNGDAEPDPIDVIFHEYTHRVLHNNLARVPVWFGEGLAECYSTFQSDAERAHVGMHVDRHLQTLRAHSLMSLRELLAVDSASETYHVGERRGMFYAQSWALVHYLLWKRPGGKEQLARYLDRLQRGERPSRAFKISFGTSHKELLNDLRHYIEQPRFHYSIIAYDELDVDTRTRVSPMNRADVLYRLGDLLAHVDDDRIPEAEPYFREALRVNPSHARSHTGLGWIEAEQGNLEGAIAHYEKALSLDANDYLSNFLLGDALLERDGPAIGSVFVPGADHPSFERAQRLFQASIREQPRFAEAYIGYGRAVLYGEGDLGAAIKLLEAARRLLPTRADVVVNLATLHQMNGDIHKARELVETVLPTLGDPEALRDAERTLLLLEEGPGPSPPEVGREGQPPAFVVVNHAYALAGSGDLEGAIKYLKRAISKSNDPETAEQMRSHLEQLEKQHERSEGIKEYNRQVQSINEAVDLANRGHLEAAIARLEKLLSRIKDDELAQETRELLAGMKKNLIRLQAGGK